MDDTIRQATRDAIEAKYVDGSKRVALRGPTGSGLSAVAIEILVAKAVEGPVLIIAPGVTHQQIKADIARVAPDLTVGELGAGTPVEIVTAFRAAIYRDRHKEDAFPFIVAEECWPNEVERLRNAVAHFEGAKVLEVMRMPGSHETNLDCDAMVDIEEVMASLSAPTP